MRVLQLGKFYPIRGGVEKVMWDLTRGLSAKGVKCDMLCACLPGDAVDYKDRDLALSPGSSQDIPESARIVLKFNDLGRVVCVPAKKKMAATMISPAMVGAMRHMIKAAEKAGEPYDVVHVHHPDPMAAVAIFLSGWRGKVVLHWHSDIVKQKKLLKFYEPLQSWLVRRADKVVGTTPVYVAESACLKKVQHKTTFLPIGIDAMEPDAGKVASLRASYPGKKLVFTLGRLVPYKGYTYLVEAAKHLPDDYMVVIGGLGPLHASLEQQAIDDGVQNKVRFLGWMDDADVANWYAAADVFALSSVMKTEAFAIVQVEAMSCGTPVVATNIPGSGVSWVNAHGVSGLNVPVCDAKALADAIVKVFDAKDAYGTAARRRFEENFTFDCMIDRCRRIYEDL